MKYLEIYFLNREFSSLVYLSIRLKAISFFCLHLTQLRYGHDGMGAGWEGEEDQQTIFTTRLCL